MRAEEFQAWQRIFRDTVIFLTGCFILVYEAVYAHPASALMVGAGLTACGLPATFRLDLGRENKRKEARREEAE